MNKEFKDRVVFYSTTELLSKKLAAYGDHDITVHKTLDGFIEY